MRRHFLAVAFVLTGLCASAQTVTRSYRDVPLPQVLMELNSLSEDSRVNFIYDDLEDFTVTCDIRRKPLAEALRMVVGNYPVSISYDGINVFVECTQKWEHRLLGRVVDERSQPVANANVQLLSPRDSSLLNVGVTNQNGRFVVPSHETPVIARISFVGYKTVFRNCPATDIGTVRLQRETAQLQNVNVNLLADEVSKSEMKYLEFVKNVKEKAWGLDVAAFRLNPDSTCGDSSVILAEYDGYEFVHKRRVHVAPLVVIPVPFTRREFTRSHLFRQQIWIKDSATLKKYSVARCRYNVVMRFFCGLFCGIRHSPQEEMPVYGFRIVKPDGTVRVVDVDKYMWPRNRDVEPSYDDKYLSIPIDSLAVGDVLDRFVYQQSAFSPQSYKDYVRFGADLPVRYRNITIRTDKQLNFQYRLIGHAPDFSIRDDGDGYLMTFETEKMDTLSVDTGAKTVFYVRDHRSSLYGGPRNSLKPGIIRNPARMDVLADPFYRQMVNSFAKARKGKVSFRVRKSKIYAYLDSLKDRGLTDEQLSDMIYHGINKDWRGIPGVREDEYLPENCSKIVQMAALLSYVGIAYDVGMSTVDGNESIEHLMDTQSIVWLIRLKNQQVYINNGAEAAYSLSNRVPACLRGRKAMLMDWTTEFYLQ